VEDRPRDCGDAVVGRSGDLDGSVVGRSGGGGSG
jgi:hypothetical protein